MGLFQEYLVMLLIVLIWIFLGFLKPVEPATVLQPTQTPNSSTTVAPKTVKDIEKELERLVTSVSKMALPYFVRNSDLNLSPKCMSTFIKMFMDIRKLKLPVIKLLDAMGKPPYGLLRGTFSVMGDYDECLEVRANKKGYEARTKEEEFYHGQYCIVEADFPPVIAKALKDFNSGKVNISVFGKLGPFMEEFSATNFADSYFKYRIGVCVPSTCTKEDVQAVLGLVPIDFIPMHVKNCQDGRPKKLKVDQAVFICVLILFGIFVLCGTLLDAWLHIRHTNFTGISQKDRFMQFLLAFSVYSNSKKLLNTKKSSSGSDISVVNGMYVMGTLLVIIYHTYFMPFFLYFSSHGANLGEHLHDFNFTLIAVMGISIDAYFLFSGLFLVYPRFRRQQKNIEINVIKIVFRRYIRLCPSMLVILGIIVFLPIFGSGPVWSEIFDVAADNTRKWWWTYALMYNNFLAVKDQNFLYLWFIPCLMQISIIGAILLWIIAKWRKLGIALTILTGLACNITLGVLTALRNYPPTYAIYYLDKREHFEETIYTGPLAHVFSFGIGMLLGLYMAKNPSLKWSKTYVVVGWIVALLMTTGSQMLSYLGHDGRDPNPILAALYASTHRTVFSLGLSWIILACTHGYGGFFGKIMSCKAFTVLSKLGYFGYLIHYIVITYHVSSTREVLMYSHYEVFMRFCSYSVLTFMAAYVLYITFEVPLTYIESLFLPARATTATSENNGGLQAINNSVDILGVKCNDVLTPDMLKQSWNEKMAPHSDGKENAEQSKL